LTRLRLPGDQADEPLSDMALTKVIRRMNHGFP
jgi:hypothetical protein